MNATFYCKLLENASKEQPTETFTSNDYEDADKLFALSSCSSKFLMPLYRILCIICNRLSEEELYNNGDKVLALCSFKLLKLTEIFNNLTQNISRDTAQEIIENLDCSDYAKSELLESIENNDSVQFKNTIKEHLPNYRKLSDICSILCLGTNFQEKIIKNIINNFEITDDDSEEDIKHKINAVAGDFIMEIKQNLKESGSADESSLANIDTYLNDYFNTITSYFQQDINFDAYLYINLKDFEYLTSTIEDLAKDKMLNQYDVYAIQRLVKKCRESLPIVDAFFSQFTQGTFLESDFSFNPIIERSTTDQMCKMIAEKPINALPIHESENQSPLDLILEKHPDLKKGQAKEIFQKAINSRIIVWDNNHFVPGDGFTKVLIVYMCGKIYCDDKIEIDPLSKQPIWQEDSEDKMPCNSLMDMFGWNIGQTRRNKKSWSAPKNYQIIDELF